MALRKLLVESKEKQSPATLPSKQKQQMLFAPAPKSALEQMLQHTAKGEAKQAITMASRNYGLALTKGSFQEAWGKNREWKHISPLQYAAWAGDKDLVNHFLHYLLTPASQQEALRQLKQVWERGTEHGKHLYAVSQLLAAYKAYKSTPRGFDRRNFKNLGTNQLHSVANLMQWFCSPTPFDPIPQFNEPVTRSLTFAGNKLDLSPSSTLGSEYFLYKADLRQPLLSPFLLTTDADYAAVNAFYVTRTQDLQQQIATLSLAVQKKEQPQSSGLPYRR